MTEKIEDTYRVLPHRNVLDCTMYSSRTGDPIGRYDLEHVPCGMSLKPVDIESNWCPHCAEVINKAARKRGQAAIRDSAA
jgi:hypothetical protein